MIYSHEINNNIIIMENILDSHPALKLLGQSAGRVLRVEKSKIYMKQRITISAKRCLNQVHGNHVLNATSC